MLRISRNNEVTGKGKHSDDWLLLAFVYKLCLTASQSHSESRVMGPPPAVEQGSVRSSD